MPALSTVILGTGSYAPSRIMTNDELSQFVETSDEWIRTRTGIRERRIAAPAEKASDLGAEASRRALADAGLTAADIDLLVVATFTPDQPLPSCASLLQTKLGIPTRAACFDVNAACTGFLYALDAASAMIASGRYRRALVIGTALILVLRNVVTLVTNHSNIEFAIIGAVILAGVITDELVKRYATRRRAARELNR